jgi:hypothetical protein
VCFRLDVFWHCMRFSKIRAGVIGVCHTGGVYAGAFENALLAALLRFC